MAWVAGVFLNVLLLLLLPLLPPLLLLLLSAQMGPLVAAGDPRKYSKMLKTWTTLFGNLCI